MRTLLLILIATVLLACSTESPKIVGHWKMEGTKGSFEFREDGSFIIGSLWPRGKELTWQLENHQLIVVGVDTFTVTELTIDNLKLVGRSAEHSLLRLDDPESASLRREEAAQHIRNLEASVRLYRSQIAHLLAETDSLRE